ncbi:MAG: carboxypeptidase-like regulatory domain-containing protein [Bacteroidia bacterium]|nr:carboxypeptidase-like regulatory domain-containing protein [Bacteroidia bacterium]
MLRKIYVLLVLFTASYLGVHAQVGTLKGKVLDATSNEPLPFANVIVELNGAQAGGSQTDFDGEFTIKPLIPGKYTIKASYIGYTTAQVNGVLISADKITFYDIKMSKGVDIKEVKIVDYKVPIVDKGNPSTQATITQEEIKAAPTRNINSVVSTAAGVFQQDEGDAVNVRGSRSESTVYFVDGIKVRGSSGLPQSGIEQITVVTGGVPAQYGDATGGIINITTRGPSRQFNGGLELVTSELFDDYGYNLVGGNISGPIITKANEDGTKRPVLGFFISGEHENQRVPDPSAIDFYEIKGDVLRNLELTPFRPNPNGNGVLKNSEFISKDDMEKISFYHNVRSFSTRLQGKLDWQAGKNVTFTVGGSYEKSDNNLFSYNSSLFNNRNNAQQLVTTYRVFGRVIHKLGSTENNKENSASLIKNAYYSIQADYSRNQTTQQDENHKDNIFDYGYIGNFKTYRAERVGQFGAPQAVVDANNDTIGFANFGNFYQDTLVTFAPGGINPTSDAYTSLWYSLAPQKDGYYNTLQAIQGGGVVGGILNGGQPSNVYSLWRNTGFINNLYQVVDNQQVRITGMASADIKDHAIQFGFEYEQRKDANWGVNPVGMWSLMRQQQNLRLTNLDYAHGSLVGDTVFAQYLYSQSGNPWTPDPNDRTIGFFEQVRKKLGVSNTTWIDLDSYDYLNNKDFLSLDLFAADELINSGLVGYRGYDYTGKNRTDKVSFQDYFSKLDANGNPTREIAPFQPIYMAGFIQDKFAINDLIFNVGVRVDRFDANQKTVKDKYSIYQTRTAGELNIANRPDNIGDGYVVYVNDVNDPVNADVIGYRDGDTWYDATGAVLADPGILERQTATGQISPYLANPDDDIQLTTFDVNTSFKDYVPQINVMPRIAFSFPISDMALFFAHYDVLTQRPTSNVALNPRDYFNLAAGTINNADLKASKTIDYELGFKQSLSRSSAITISAFYRELRDMIQQVRVNYAYPFSYTSYGNRDFGTVKGFSITYDLRRTGNVRLSASYTLQFADGTGSNSASNSELINSGQPNLFQVAPLDFDQRHNIVASVDYRYSSGADYNGPMWFGKQFFANAGANFIFRAGSGTPYSATSNIRTEADNIGLQQQGTTQLKGGVNTSRLPWQFRADLRVDKDFMLKAPSGSNQGLVLNVYLQIQNLFDTKNVINVYRATGSPSDDGYLSYAPAQGLINNATDVNAYRDLYDIKVNNPNNFSIPRRMRLGVELQF